MKRKRVLIALLSVFLLVGCKESPQNDIITNKNDDTLEKAIGENADDEGTNELKKNEMKKEDSFQVVTGDIEVKVKADVHLNEGKKTVVKVKAHEISSEDLKKWCDVLFEGKKAYDPASPKSKSDIERELLEWKEAKSKLTEECLETSELEEVSKSYDEMIANLESAYEQAPDAVERLESDYMFHPYEYYLSEDVGILDESDKQKKDMKFDAITDYENGMAGEILATNRNESDYSMHAISYVAIEEEKVNIAKADCSEKDAMTLVEDVIDKLGLKDWKICNVVNETGDACCHTFSFTRYYGDIPTITGMEIDLQSDDLYASNLYYEELGITVENGKITRVGWYSPMDVIEEENTNVKTLSFDEVYECFKSQMQSQYSKRTYLENGWLLDENYEEAEIAILVNKIEEGMFRVKIKDSTEEYRMIPVWVFRGITTVKGIGSMEENYVVINAIDGSIINPTLGY